MSDHRRTREHVAREARRRGQDPVTAIIDYEVDQATATVATLERLKTVSRIVKHLLDTVEQKHAHAVALLSRAEPDEPSPHEAVVLVYECRAMVQVADNIIQFIHEPNPDSEERQ